MAATIMAGIALPRSRAAAVAACLMPLLGTTTAEAKILWQQAERVTVRESAVELNCPEVSPRNDASVGTLYFKFRVDPRSDTLTKIRNSDSFTAGLVFHESEHDHLGIGIASNAWGYSAFAPTFRKRGNIQGEYHLATDKPDEPDMPWQAPRRGALRTFIVKVDYIPQGDDVVTVWLEPRLGAGANEASQPEATITRFKANASFDQIRLVHFGVGDGWVFDDLAIATEFEDFAPVPWYQNKWLLGSIALGIAAISAAAMAGIERRRANRQVAIVEREQAVATERVRIAQDLHDDLGAKVTEIVLLGELAKRGDKDANPLPEILAGLRELHASLDQAVWSINPRNDSLAELLEFVSDAAQRFLRHAPVEFHLDVAELPPAMLGASQRNHLALAIKEALNNAVRHAAARSIRLSFHHEGQNLHATITDDGCGFKEEPSDGCCDGLKNMKARLKSVGGSADIQSTPGQGTVVKFRMPLAVAQI